MSDYRSYFRSGQCSDDFLKSVLHHRRKYPHHRCLTSLHFYKLYKTSILIIVNDLPFVNLVPTVNPKNYLPPWNVTWPFCYFPHSNPTPHYSSSQNPYNSNLRILFGSTFIVRLGHKDFFLDMTFLWILLKPCIYRFTTIYTS